MTILIKNGRVVDPSREADGQEDVLIKNGKIAAVGRIPEEAVSYGKDVRVIDAQGLTIVPGLMDPHVHFRDPGFTEKEDIITGAAAAKRGGFTRVVCMANTKPVIDNPQRLRENQRRSEKTGIHVFQDSAVTAGLKGEQLVPMEEMASAGAPGFTDDGKPLMNERLLKEAMERAARLHKPISLHEEDPLFVNGAGVNQGKTAALIGYGGADEAAEYILTARDCMLALAVGARICIQHISSARSVEIVRMARKMGADVHAEATPHHFTLTEEDVLTYGTNARMNPPLRTQKDRDAIREGLKDGTIDMIATDHAPHTAAEKARPMPQAPSGIIGLETSLGLGIRSLVRPGILTLRELIYKMSTAPALFYNMTPASVREGADADLTIFGEDEEWKVTDFASKAQNSPFTGWILPGRIHYTICGGHIVYE